MEPLLHGRDAPLTALRAALASAFAGCGQLALVSGEAGIGKSAIAAAIAREAESRKAVVTWGRAWEFADAPPYFPVWPCLRALGIDLAQYSHQQHDEGHAFQLWEQVVGSLAHATAIQPAVWVLEDLHAADLGTLDLLTFLAQPLRAMRVLVIATARAQDPRLTDRMTQRLTRMARDGVDVRLDPLTDHDIAALTAEILGREVPESALRRLSELTGGNPLFVVECARSFRSAGGIESALGALPATVRQVVLDRVALLPDTTRHALASGAVLGREFSAASVARMAKSLPARVIDVLLPALRSGLISETLPGQFLFSHTLVRDAIDDALGAEQRAALHGQADHALSVLGESAGVLLERARHALAALPTGGDGHALGIATRAAELLEHEGAFDRAFELHTRIGDAQRAGLLPPASPKERLHVARIAHAAGRSDIRRRLCEEVIASARAAGDAELMAHAALLHAADVRPSVVDRSQLALLEEAHHALPTTLPELQCRVLARLAAALQPAVDPAVPAAMAREAIQKARATGNDAVILEVLEVGSWGLYFAPLAEQRAYSAELLERALRANDLPKALFAREWLAFHDMQGGDFEAFERDADSLLTLSDEVGHPRHRWRPLLIASTRATTLGHFAESDRYVTEVSRLATLTDDPALPFALAIHEVMRLKAQRRDGELRSAIAKIDPVMGDVWQGTQLGAVMRANCAARMEDIETTRAELSILGARASSIDDPMVLSMLAEPTALCGTEANQRRILELLSKAPHREVIGGHLSFGYEGTVPRLLGLLAAALGDLPAAEQHLRAAHGLAVARKHAPMAAQTGYELARIVRRLGRDLEARQLLEAAAQVARDLGMTGLERCATASSDPSPSVDSPAPTVKFERTEAGWKVSLGELSVTVKDSRGMQLLAKLVERPDEEMHVLALATDEPTAQVSESDAGELLDDRARAAYRQRLADLDQGIAEAEAHADLGRTGQLEREREALLAELSRAVGLGGRARRAGSATERARVNVQRRVKDAVARIAELDQALGRFFERSVCTGTFCSFRPR